MQGSWPLFLGPPEPPRDPLLLHSSMNRRRLPPGHGVCCRGAIVQMPGDRRTRGSGPPPGRKATSHTTSTPPVWRGTFSSERRESVGSTLQDRCKDPMQGPCRETKRPSRAGEKIIWLDEDPLHRQGVVSSTGQDEQLLKPIANNMTRPVTCTLKRLMSMCASLQRPVQLCHCATKRGYPPGYGRDQKILQG